MTAKIKYMTFSKNKKGYSFEEKPYRAILTFEQKETLNIPLNVKRMYKLSEGQELSQNQYKELKQISR